MGLLKCLKSCARSIWHCCITPHKIMLWMVVIFCFTVGGSWYLKANPYLLNHYVQGCNTLEAKNKSCENEESKKCKEEHDAEHNYPLDSFYYWLTGLGTVWLVVVAYIKIGEINKNDEAHFFLKLDERWTSKEILDAKVVIRGVEMRHRSHAENRQLMVNAISKDIFDLLERTPADESEKGKKAAEHSALLINFLDFMETIGFLYKHSYVKYRDIDAICGESMAYYYEIFKLYIKEKQRCKREDGMVDAELRLPYHYFEQLANEVARREGCYYSDCDQNCNTN